MREGNGDRVGVARGGRGRGGRGRGRGRGRGGGLLLHWNLLSFLLLLGLLDSPFWLPVLFLLLPSSLDGTVFLVGVEGEVSGAWRLDSFFEGAAFVFLQCLLDKGGWRKRVKGKGKREKGKEKERGWKGEE